MNPIPRLGINHGIVGCIRSGSNKTDNNYLVDKYEEHHKVTTIGDCLLENISHLTRNLGYAVKLFLQISCDKSFRLQLCETTLEETVGLFGKMYELTICDCKHGGRNKERLGKR